MLEILSRDGLARETRWSAGRHELVSPDILFIVSGRYPDFCKAKSCISDREIDGKFTVISGGSWFVPGGASGPGETVIAPFPSIPAGLEEDEGQAADAARESYVASGSKIFPVSGASFSGIRETGAELFVWAGALGSSLWPRDFARELAKLKMAAGYGRLIYAPGMGEPGHIALLMYCGIDLFDSAPLAAAARRGVRLFPGYWAHSSERGLCHCPACENGTGDFGTVYLHNCYSALAELNIARSALRNGKLRELVETRLSEPWMVAALRHLDLRHHEMFEPYLPISRQSGMLALSGISFFRPEVVRFRQRVLERCRRPLSAPVLLLLPCSARKPYSSSVSHRAFRTAVEGCANPGAVHEVVITSPLGVVPMELECFYPAGSYDVPVTGDWDDQEKRVIADQLRSFVVAGKYSAVVCHLHGMDFLKDALPADTVFTGGDRPLSRSSLEHLRSALALAVANIPKVKWKQAQRERLSGLCTFQFGDCGKTLLENCEVKFTGPNPKFISPDRKQTGMFVHERGMVSLTLEGGARLLGRSDYEVEIGDFVPSGSVFPVGIDRAGRSIRPGDDVVIAHRGELRAVGAAQMSGPEMEERGRGTAIRTRHHIKRGGETDG